MSNCTDKCLTLVLRLGAFCCFVGWTWLHLYWEGPYGTLLWQDTTYKLAQFFGFDWDAFVGSGSNDGLIQRVNALIGWFYLAFAVLCLTVRKKNGFQPIALYFSTALFAVLFYAKYLGAQKQLPMFVEHGGQLLSPLLLVFALQFGPRHKIVITTAFIAFIMTFAGHGVYAVGLWPTPANFFGMTTTLLHVEYPTARILLHIFGLLDFLICIGIFIPCIRKYCTLYAIVWGALTAIARPAAGMSLELNYWGADLYLHEMLLRTPHFLIPLYLYLVFRPTATGIANSSAKKAQSDHLD